jgi:hypothetical protein
MSDVSGTRNQSFATLAMEGTITEVGLHKKYSGLIDMYGFIYASCDDISNKI